MAEIENGPSEEESGEALQPHILLYQAVVERAQSSKVYKDLKTSGEKDTLVRHAFDLGRQTVSFMISLHPDDWDWGYLRGKFQEARKANQGAIAAFGQFLGERGRGRSVTTVAEPIIRQVCSVIKAERIDIAQASRLLDEAQAIVEQQIATVSAQESNGS